MVQLPVFVGFYFLPVPFVDKKVGGGGAFINFASFKVPFCPWERYPEHCVHWLRALTAERTALTERSAELSELTACTEGAVRRLAHTACARPAGKGGLFTPPFLNEFSFFKK